MCLPSLKLEVTNIKQHCHEVTEGTKKNAHEELGLVIQGKVHMLKMLTETIL
jgi:hypothetical protein